MTITNKLGFTLIEVLVALLLFGSFSLMIGSGYRLLASTQIQSDTKSEVESEVASLFHHVLKVGRHSTSCRLESDSQLVCRADMSGNPVAQPPMELRFVWKAESHTVEYQVETEQGSGVLVPRIVYKNIDRFLICDDQQMAIGCSIGTGDSISARHVANLAGAFDGIRLELRTRPGRFFRFAIVGQGDLKKLGALWRTVDFQGAFYVRNPAPRSLKFANFIWPSSGE